MQHFILHCSELESTRASFISALCDLVVCEDNEELLGLILDPSTACTLEENSDSGETQIFLLARGLCYALHVQRYTLLASHGIATYSYSYIYCDRSNILPDCQLC